MKHDQIIRSYRGPIFKLLSIGAGGGAIFVISTGDGRQVKAVVPWNVLPVRPYIGETWRVEGFHEADPRGGRQLRVVNAFVEKPRGEEIVHFVGYHPRFAELDPRAARRIWRRHGPSFLSALESSHYFQLASIASMGLQEAVDLCERWHDYWAEAELAHTLVNAQLPAGLTDTLLRFFGRPAVNAIKINPYLAIPFASWKVIDVAAVAHLGIRFDADVRLIGAVDSSCYDRSRLGDTALSTIRLEKMVAAKLGSPELAEKAISLAVDQHRIIRLDSEGTITYQAIGLFRVETAILARIARISEVRHSNASQRLSIWEALGIPFRPETPISIVFAEGHPPADIAARFSHSCCDVLHIFPSNEDYTAALAQVQNSTVMFLPSLLSSPRPLKSNIDEVFLYAIEGLVAPTFNKLLHRLPVGARVNLVVRSRHHVASGPGAVLHAFLAKRDIAAYDLTTVLRAPLTALPNALRHIAVGERPSTHAELEADSQFVKHVYTNGWSATLREAIALYYETKSLGSTRIILPSVELCREVNVKLHEEAIAYLREMKEPASYVSLNGDEFCTTGEPIVCNRPLWELGLLEGSLGTITSVFGKPEYEVRDGKSAPILASADFGGDGPIMLTKSDLETMSLAYALPIQRMQFSSTRRVIIPLVESQFLDRFWLHTAVACATTGVYFVGDDEVLKLAVQHTVHRRARQFGVLGVSSLSPSKC